METEKKVEAEWEVACSPSEKMTGLAAATSQPMHLRLTRVTPVMIVDPPEPPTICIAFPLASVKIDGLIDDRGRLPGSSRLVVGTFNKPDETLSGSSKSASWSLKMMPVRRPRCLQPKLKT